MTTRPCRPLLVVSLTLALAATIVAGPTAATAATTHALIQGSGSTGAANAVNQWIADESSAGLNVVYSSTGSAQGRRDFANNSTDFAVSELGFQGTDPATGTSDTSQGRAYAYLPITAGGTALTFHIERAGKLVRNLRLSGETIAKIFTQKITNWDDPQITRDNHGTALPDLEIIPVQHGEASGVTYQFTRYLATRFPSIWTTGATATFPAATGNAVAANGSDGVMNYVTSSSANGAIGYDEYAYPLLANYPVAKVLNSAGYYTAPTPFNVAIALRAAVINSDKSSPNYLLQNVDRVYTNADPRTYPLSSYTYAIIPTAADDRVETTAKRQTLVDFLGYGVCDGQKETGQIGYAPLPLNLVRAAFDQLRRLHNADAGVDVSRLDVSSCSNPTFATQPSPHDTLDATAPQPPECDSAAHNPCGTPPDSTSFTAPHRLTIVSAGARNTITSRLTDQTTRTVLGSTAVTLWRRYANSPTWTRIASLRTDASGVARAAVTTTRTSEYQFRYAGDIDRSDATSAGAVIRVRA